MKNKPAPFTENQRGFFDRSQSCWFNVAEGGKRGGKNVLTTLIFCSKLEEHPNKVHLIAGVSIATAKLNIVDCDGYGLLNYFSGRCREGEYKNRDCLYVQTRTGLKIVLISGGGKDGDEKLIKGNTYGMAYITETNECAKKFIQEVFDRTISSQDRKIFHDLNPKTPAHWYYTDVLKYHDEAQNRNQKYGYNYGHFTIADNMSVSDSQLRAVLCTYDKQSVWYKRDILGERRAAEGLIYQQLADNPQRWVLKTESNEAKKLIQSIDFISIGVDFGGNRSLTTFVATGILRGFSGLLTLRDHYIKGRKGEIDSERVNQEFIFFVYQLQQDYPKIYIKFCFADNEAQYLINGLRKAIREAGLAIEVRDSDKNPITQRIYCTSTLLNTNRLHFLDSCTQVINGLSCAAWDEKAAEKGKDVRLDNFTSDIDTVDGFEYSWERFMKKLLPDAKGIQHEHL